MHEPQWPFQKRSQVVCVCVCMLLVCTSCEHCSPQISGDFFGAVCGPNIKLLVRYHIKQVPHYSVYKRERRERGRKGGKVVGERERRERSRYLLCVCQAVLS